MYTKILVPMALDHDISPHTLRVAQALSAEGAEVIALHVYEAPQGTASVYLDDEVVRKSYAKARATLVEKLAGHGKIKPEIIKGHTARSIIDYAQENQIDCIVIGSHKPGFSDFFLGSTASRVVRHASCAVHVHRSS